MSLACGFEVSETQPKLWPSFSFAKQSQAENPEIGGKQIRNRERERPGDGDNLKLKKVMSFLAFEHPKNDPVATAPGSVFVQREIENPLPGASVKFLMESFIEIRL